MQLRSGKIYTYVPPKKTKKTKAKVTKNNIVPLVKNVMRNQAETKQYFVFGDYLTVNSITPETWTTLQIQSGGSEQYMPLYGIQQEDPTLNNTSFSRNGSKIEVNYIHFRSSLVFPYTATGTSPDYFRVVVVQLKRNASANIQGIVSYLNSKEPATSPNAMPNSCIFKKLDVLERLYVISDKIYTRQNIYNLTQNQSIFTLNRTMETKMISLNIKPKVPNVQWQVGTTKNANPDDNGAIAVLVRYYQNQISIISGTPSIQSTPEILVNFKEK